MFESSLSFIFSSSHPFFCPWLSPPEAIFSTFLSIHSVFSLLSSTPFLHQCCGLLYTSCPPSLHVCAWCLAASESVLLQQLFQSKMTQTGSLVPAAQGRIGLRGTKAALLFQKMPSASSVNATSVPQQPRRYHDLTKVKHIGAVTL